VQAFPWICCKTLASKWLAKLSAALSNLEILPIQQALSICWNEIQRSGTCHQNETRSPNSGRWLLGDLYFYARV